MSAGNYSDALRCLSDLTRKRVRAKVSDGQLMFCPPDRIGPALQRWLAKNRLPLIALLEREMGIVWRPPSKASHWAFDAAGLAAALEDEVAKDIEDIFLFMAARAEDAGHTRETSEMLALGEVMFYILQHHSFVRVTRKESP